MSEQAANLETTVREVRVMQPVSPTYGDHTVRWFDIWNNPIAQRCRRARLRPRHLLTYGVLGLSITTFIFLVIYLPTLRRFDATPAIAAKATLVPLFILQGILLMGMGTAALATGLARERDRELLDYQRMTPLSPTAKIMGYLFGLPAREYVLFGITLPFVAYAVWRAELPVLNVGKFYLAFFSSVWVYHMTGLCVGMVSKKPWQASVVSLGSVAVLYLVIPNLSTVGLGFLEYLTARPTFYNLIAEELNRFPPEYGRPDWFKQYGDVPFYHLHINPMLFSLILQGLVLATLYFVLRRKWIDAGWHAFSKRFGVVFALGVHVLLLGSLWPTLRDETQLQQLMGSMRIDAGPHVFGWVLGLFLALSTATVAMVVYLITPGVHTARKGFRRARKLGKSAVPMGWDAAPALRWVLLLLLIAGGGYALVIASGRTSGEVFAGPIRWGWTLAPLAVVAAAVLFFHGVAEWFSVRALGLVLFVLWGLPLLAAIIVVASTDAYIPALYLGSVSPAVPGVLAVLTLMQETGVELSWRQQVIAEDLRPHVPAMIAIFVVGYAVLAILVQAGRIKWMRRWRAAEASGVRG